jgi:hypothetical protein
LRGHELDAFLAVFGGYVREAFGGFLQGKILDAVAGQAAPEIDPRAAKGAVAIVDEDRAWSVFW